MPENISGHPGVPAPGDAESSLGDALARIEDQLAELTRAVAALSARISDAEAEAEDILRRAILPAPQPRRASHFGETVLRVVKAFAFAAAGAGLVLALASPHRVSPRGCHLRRATPVAAVRCALTPVRLDADGDRDSGI